MNKKNQLYCRDEISKYQQVVEMSLDKAYILNPRFRLRAESTRVLLYSYESGLNSLADTHYTIHPCLAILLALMDGKRTFSQVAEAYDYVIGCDPSSCKECMKDRRHMVDWLRKREPDILVEPLGTPLEETTRLSPMDFVIDGANVDCKTPNPRLDFPLSITFHLNLGCNRSCIYCYAPSQIKELPHMPVSRYIELFDEALEKKVGNIQFGGADALLNPEVLPLTSAVLERGFDPQISTKQYVSPELAGKFADLGLPEMQVSLDSVDPQTAAKMTGCPEYLSIAYKSIENLKNAGIVVRAKAVATAMNIEGIPALIREMERRGVESLLVDTYGRSLFRHSDDLFASNEAMAECQLAMDAYRRNNPKMTVLGNCEPYHAPPKALRELMWETRAACSPGRSALTIMTNGSILLCDQVPVTSDFIFGSVSEESIEEVWKSDTMHNLVFPPKMELQEPCRTCDEYLACCNDGGRCLRDVYFAHEIVTGGDPKCPRVDIPIRL